MIGSGIFLMAGSIARELDSIAAVISVWTIGGLLSLAGALSLSELGAAFPAAGGLYVYLIEAYGPTLGFIYGWSAVSLIHAGSIATMAAAIGFYSAPLLGLSPLQQKVLQVSCIAFFTLVNSLGVSMGKTVQNVLTVIKVGGLVSMVALLYAKGSAALIGGHLFIAGAHHLPLAPFGVALVAVLWAYDGWHMVSFTAGEIRDPGRTLPRSLLIGTLLTTMIYLFANVAYYAVLTPDAIRATDRVAAAAVQVALGPQAGLFISILIIVSILGAINGVMLGAPRINLAMARDGLFFRQFARVSQRSHARDCHRGSGGVGHSVTLIGSFRELFTSYVFTSWIFYGLAVAAVLLLRKRRPDLRRPFLCPLYPLTPIFFVAASLGIVVMNLVVYFRQAMLGIALILIGWPLYFIFRYLERDRGLTMNHEG